MINIANTVKDIISRQFYILREKVVDELQIIKDIGADSIDLMELYMNLENTFHISFTEDEMLKMINISDIINHIKKNIKN